ncbi:MAG TPA: ribosome recycling factor [Bacteroidales bacterium]
MEEEVQLYLEDAKDKMEKAVNHLASELVKMRAGKASPQMLDGIHVDYYGTSTPLAQVANINTPDAKSIVIQPWEKKIIGEIEKAILAANIGVTPMNNGDVVRLNLPPLTEERRKQLVKTVRHEGENAKVSIRNARREVIEELKRLQKEGLPEDSEKNATEKVEKMTENYYKKVDDILGKKENEIMTV